MTETTEPSKGGNKVGRPRLIDSPETFDMLVDSYVDMCRTANEPILLTGMVLSLGLFSKESFYDYAGYPEFFQSVKRAKLIVEAEYEKRLNTGTNAAGSIFALKNFGWADKHPTYLDELQAKKLERELQLDDEQAQPTQVIIGVEDASKPKA